MLCLKCEHVLHEQVCNAIEGKIEGKDRRCVCTLTADENKERMKKIKERR